MAQGARGIPLRCTAHGSAHPAATSREVQRAGLELALLDAEALGELGLVAFDVLDETASNLKAQFKNIRVSWVPREMNAEADRLVQDALRA